MLWIGRVLMLSGFVLSISSEQVLAETDEQVCMRLARAGGFALSARLDGAPESQVQAMFRPVYPENEFPRTSRLVADVIRVMYSQSDEFMRNIQPLNQEALEELEASIFDECIQNWL